MARAQNCRPRRPMIFRRNRGGEKSKLISHRDGRGIQIVIEPLAGRAGARRTTLFGKMPIEVIPYGLDTETFQPRDRKAAREKFGIDPAAKVALFVADWASARNGKDWSVGRGGSKG